MKKRLLSLMLALAMVLGMVPMSAMAAARDYTQADIINGVWLDYERILYDGMTKDTVTGDLYLPETDEVDDLSSAEYNLNGYLGMASAVTWTSSNETVVAPDGTVTRPEYEIGADTEVILTATITKGTDWGLGYLNKPTEVGSDMPVDFTGTKQFTVTVLAETEPPVVKPTYTDQELVNGAVALFSLEGLTIRGTTDKADLSNLTYHVNGIPYNINYIDKLPGYLPEYKDIACAWTTTGGALGQGNSWGTVTRTNEDQVGEIILTLTLGEATATNSWDYEVPAFTQAEAGIETAALNEVATALDFDDIKRDNTDVAAVTEPLLAVQGAEYIDGSLAFDDSTVSNVLGANITWESSDTAVISDTPEMDAIIYDDVLQVTQPKFDTEVTLTATLTSPRFPELVTPVTKKVVVTVAGERGVRPAPGSYGDVLVTMEEAYASQAITQNWENIAFADVDFPAFDKDDAAYASIQAIKEGTNVGNMMKAVFTLKMLGYDPADITLEDDTKLNAYDILNEKATATSLYVAPYVLLALGDNATEAQRTAHISYLCGEIVKESSYGYGLDGAAFAIAALAPYYDQAEVKTAVDTAMEMVATKLVADPSKMNTNTNAIVTLAYTMLGLDPTAAVYSDGVDVVANMLDAKLEDGSGFGWGSNEKYNGWATKQGMVALKALVAYEKTNGAVNPFEFSVETLTAVDEAVVNPAARSITVIVNLSKNGEFVIGKDNTQMVGVEVTLDIGENETHDIDGALKKAHALYYDGEYGYMSDEGSLYTLWGDMSGNFGYWYDGNSAWSLTDGLSDGSVVDAFINGGSYYDETLESYSKFDAISSAKAGEATTINLKQAGYDDDWVMVITPCAGATIYIDGEATTAVTDENGQASITFATVGEHWISAKKDANDDGITDIVAPYAVVEVSAASGGGTTTPDDSHFDITFSITDDKNRTWFTETVTVDEGDTVKDAFDAAFAKHEDYKVEIDGGTYVKSITHPTYGKYGEFTSGNNSGWKYKVNGIAPANIAFSSYEVEADDEVVFYFVVDYNDDSTPSTGGSSVSKPAVEPEEEETTVPTFGDVAEDVWFAEAVNFVVEAGLFKGVSDTEFAPDANTTRASIWTVLARRAGIDTTPAEGQAWYQPALDWAIENGISDGTGADGNITREQLAVMLYRAALAQDEDVSVGENTNILSYNDAFGVSDWAMDAIQWACGAQILKGDDQGNLNPQGNATRAEVATMMMRYLSK